MLNTITEIRPVPTGQTIPTCQPNLMPFHIEYSGPAPISTYFLVEPAKERVGAPDAPREPEITTANGDEVKMLEAEAAPSVPASDEMSQPPAETQVSSQIPVANSSGNSEASKEHAHTRFVSSFRGRKIHGLRVELPPGYSGLVLRPAEEATSHVADGSSSLKAPTTTARRSTRRKKSKVEDPIVVQDDVDEVMADDTFSTLNTAEETAIRVLNPVASFSSLMLWNQDNPVIETRDEYYRSLTEWVGIASLINQIDN